MVCPLCRQRKARRNCPALRQDICPVCCGTKRLVEIQCPSDCPYLTSARDHPPSTVRRQQQQDLARLLHGMRDLSERQAQLFLMLGAFLARYQAPEFHVLSDADVRAAAEALAATFEAAARGVIYEPRPTSVVASQLAAALQPVLADAGKGGGTSFERDAGVVLRRVEEAARALPGDNVDTVDDRAFLHLLARMLKQDDRSPEAGPESSRLIVS